MADDNWFSMFYNLLKAYTGDSADLTIFGKVVVNDPTVGLLAVAKKPADSDGKQAAVYPFRGSAMQVPW